MEVATNDDTPTNARHGSRRRPRRGHVRFRPARTDESTTYEAILAAVDGSKRARRAAEYAVDLASRYDASVHAVFVVDTHMLDEPALGSAELSTDLIEDAGHEFLMEVEELAEERGVPFERRSVHGVPKFEMLDYAANLVRSPPVWSPPRSPPATTPQDPPGP